MIVLCSYCKCPAALVTGKEIYPHRPDLFSKNFYSCTPCRAYVGCHKGTAKPLGRLANAELRAAKSNAHSWFDDVWKEGHMTRTEAYAWLAQQLNIPVKDCHIGMFDVATCEKVTDVVNDNWCSIVSKKAFGYDIHK